MFHWSSFEKLLENFSRVTKNIRTILNEKRISGIYTGHLYIFNAIFYMLKCATVSYDTIR